MIYLYKINYSKLIILFFIYLVFVDIPYLFYSNTNNNALFHNIYTNTRNKLYLLTKELENCLTSRNIYCCMSEDYDVYNSLYTKEYYYFHHFNNSELNNFKYNNNILIFPFIKNNYDIIIGIPVSTHHLSRRIAIRETYGQLKKINGMNIKLYFILCYTKNNSNNYKFSLLKIENNIYNDLLVFNIKNSYKTLVLQMLLFYQYIINTHNYSKYYIRLDSDVFFNPYYLPKHIRKECDVVGDKGYSFVPYVGGPFQIINWSTLNKLNEGAHFIRPIIVTEDLYTGIVLSKYNISFCYVKKLFDYIHLKNDNTKYIFKRNFTVIHKVTSSGLLYLYNYYVNKKGMVNS